jgi:hypothetical protein
MAADVCSRVAERYTPRHLKAIGVAAKLAPFVDGMWEWDVPDATMGRAITGKLLPSVAPQFALHYGAPMQSDRLGVAAEYYGVGISQAFLSSE